MSRIAHAMSPLATWVRTVILPGLSDKGDVSDWLDAGGTVADLKGFVAGTAVVRESRPVESDTRPVSEDGATAPTIEASPSPHYMCTAFGNTDRFVDAYADDLRYVAEWVNGTDGMGLDGLLTRPVALLNERNPSFAN